MRPPINTRSETAHQKPMFKDSFFRRRCIIPAQGFYEWPYQKKGANPAYYYLEDDDALMGFAGIWSQSDGEDRKPLVTFSILTKEAIAPFKDTHPRMPVMLTPEQCKIWMFEPAMDARRVLPQHELRMTGHEVSTAVNNPANNNQELIRQLAPATLF